jgi:DNA-binding response OmpR family regulator
MPGELHGKKVLLVDDDRDILAAMTIVLEEMGPEIATASDGDEALTAAESAPPDIVVLDMMMPKRSGMLVLEKLRRGKARMEPPHVVMITANRGHRHKAYAEALGVSAYLYKPFRMEQLVEIVKKIAAG